jgi:hypothetical protein
MSMSSRYRAGQIHGREQGAEDREFAGHYGIPVDAERAFSARVGGKEWAEANPDYSAGFLAGYRESA